MLPNYDPLMQALIASLFTWGVTALGAALGNNFCAMLIHNLIFQTSIPVFILPSNSRTFLDGSLGFAGGVMTAASFWSLLAPAIEISEAKMGAWAFVPVAIGFALGAAFVCFSDKMIPRLVMSMDFIPSTLVSILVVLVQNFPSSKPFPAIELVKQ
jgi:zinc transporter ZupT